MFDKDIAQVKVKEQYPDIFKEPEWSKRRKLRTKLYMRLYDKRPEVIARKKQRYQLKKLLHG